MQPLWVSDPLHPPADTESLLLDGEETQHQIILKLIIIQKLREADANTTPCPVIKSFASA